MSTHDPASKVPDLLPIAEYGLCHGNLPVVAMTNELGESLQNAGIATREDVTMMLSTSLETGYDPAEEDPRAVAGQSLLDLPTVCAADIPMRFDYDSRVGGYVASTLDQQGQA